MALNIHTDPQFERRLLWLSRRSRKTKTAVIKELVGEQYRLARAGFRFAALRTRRAPSSKQLQRALKQLDRDRDLD